MVEGKSKKPIKRSREGCITCKERKVKCDLEKPVCRACRSGRKRRECVYETPRPWIFDPVARPAIAEIDLPSAVADDDDDIDSKHDEFRNFAPLTVLAARPQVSHRGNAAFQYYLDCVVPANAELQGGTEFWKIMAQWHDSEPAMMHLIQAYGTLNRAWWNSHDVSLRVFFFESLSNGLQAFHRRSRLYQDEIFVFTALLLAAVEELREMDVRAARPHVDAASKIIADWPEDPEEWPIHTRHLRLFLKATIMPGLVITHMKINMAERGFKLAAPSGAASQSTPSIGGLTFGNTSFFVDAADAAGELQEVIIFWVCPLVCGQRHAWVGILDPKNVHGLLDTWVESFTALKNAFPASELEMAKRKVIEANYLAAKAAVMCGIAQWTNVSVERHAQKFIDVLDVLEDFLNLGLTAEETRQATSIVGLVSPMFLVATCARDHSVKKRALTMLREHDIKEGVWNSHAAALVAGVVTNYQRHSQLRLAYSGAQVKPWYQASRVTTTFDSENKRTEMCVHLYDISRSEKEEAICKATFEGEDDEMCREMEWPLHAIIRSFGVYRTNRFPTPLMQTTPREIRRGR